MVFEVTWKRADLAWKTLPRSRDLPKALYEHVGWMLEETVWRHMPCPKARVVEMLWEMEFLFSYRVGWGHSSQQNMGLSSRSCLKKGGKRNCRGEVPPPVSWVIHTPRIRSLVHFESFVNQKCAWSWIRPAWFDLRKGFTCNIGSDRNCLKLCCKARLTALVLVSEGSGASQAGQRNFRCRGSKLCLRRVEIKIALTCPC